MCLCLHKPMLLPLSNWKLIVEQCTITKFKKKKIQIFLIKRTHIGVCMLLYLMHLWHFLDKWRSAEITLKRLTHLKCPYIYVIHTKFDIKCMYICKTRSHTHNHELSDLTTATRIFATFWYVTNWNTIWWICISKWIECY